MIGRRVFEEFSKIPPASASKPDFRAGAGQGGASRASGVAGKILWPENAAQRHLRMTALMALAGLRRRTAGEQRRLAFLLVVCVVLVFSLCSLLVSFLGPFGLFLCCLFVSVCFLFLWFWVPLWVPFGFWVLVLFWVSFGPLFGFCLFAASFAGFMRNYLSNQVQMQLLLLTFA